MLLHDSFRARSSHSQQPRLARMLQMKEWLFTWRNANVACAVVCLSGCQTGVSEPGMLDRFCHIACVRARAHSPDLSVRRLCLVSVLFVFCLSTTLVAGGATGGPQCLGVSQLDASAGDLRLLRAAGCVGVFLLASVCDGADCVFGGAVIMTFLAMVVLMPVYCTGTGIQNKTQQVSWTRSLWFSVLCSSVSRAEDRPAGRVRCSSICSLSLSLLPPLLLSLLGPSRSSGT